MSPTTAHLLSGLRAGAVIRSLGKCYRLVSPEDLRGIRVGLAQFRNLEPHLEKDSRFSSLGVTQWKLKK